MRNWFAFAFICICLHGCSNDPQSSYVGVWQTTTAPIKTIEISKSGESYIFQDLRATKFNGEPEGPMPLSLKGNQLTLNNGLTDLPLALSNENQTLLIAGLSLKKMPSKEGENLKQQIVSERTERVANLAKCDQLGKEMDVKDKALRPLIGKPEYLTQQAALKAEKTERALKIPDCKRHLMIF